ncbi:hypothetical protein WDV91_02730 [Curtobacterium flaccumfaciens pv. flaccumfaciens]
MNRVAPEVVSFATIVAPAVALPAKWVVPGVNVFCCCSPSILMVRGDRGALAAGLGAVGGGVDADRFERFVLVAVLHDEEEDAGGAPVVHLVAADEPDVVATTGSSADDAG